MKKYLISQFDRINTKAASLDMREAWDALAAAPEESSEDLRENYRKALQIELNPATLKELIIRHALAKAGVDIRIISSAEIQHEIFWQSRNGKPFNQELMEHITDLLRARYVNFAEIIRANIDIGD